ncbi:MAG: pyridoxal phosphate-dependent aminotransferase [Ornithinimicrobium sp.]
MNGQVSSSAARPLKQSSKLQNVLYEIRGPVAARAAALEAAGHRILKLNIGNPAPFGFDAPDAILQDMLAALPSAQGYSESRGIPSARRAIVSRYQEVPGFPSFDIDAVYLGNGVSELIMMVLSALLDDRDEVLIPAPDYPLWTAATSLAGGTPVHYLADESDSWNPSIEDIRAKITAATKAIVIINPNNPTGAVYSREVLEEVAQLAQEHSLLILADEIYDRILYEDAKHISMAEVAPDLMVLTLNGLSKTYRVAGYRAGWLIITGPTAHATGFLEGIELLASTRLCPNVPGQHAIQAAVSGHQSINELICPGGRLAQQRDLATAMLDSMPGVSCVTPRGALYVFPRLDPDVHEIRDDVQLCLDLLEQEHLLLVHGTGFNWPSPDHLRIVTLPWAGELEAGLERLGNFLAHYRQ